MVSPRFFLLLVLLMFITPADSINYGETLTKSECKAYSASEDINKILQAFFSCNKKWLSPSRKRISRQEKDSLLANDAD